MLKERPGDQPLPTTSTGGASVSNDCQATVLARVSGEIPARRKLGIERYGTALMPFNGRSSIRDCWEEILDMMVYFEQVRREWDAMQSILLSVTQANDYDAIEDCKASARNVLTAMGKVVPNDAE